MNRRQLIVGALSAALLRVSADLGVKLAPPAVVFDPIAYRGGWQWVNIATKDIWEERHRSTYSELVLIKQMNKPNEP
jgi:hypothetical protein